MASNARMHIDPETGIPDLVRSLADDSRRLAGDEVRLAKLELHQSVRMGLDGSLRLALGLAFGIVAAVALTVLLVTAIGRLFNNHYWAGAVIVGVLELIIGVILMRRGLTEIRKPSYSLEESRESLKDTATWVKHAARR